MLSEALAVLPWGWAVVPVPHGAKAPRIAWKRYQAERPSEAELRSWFAEDVGMGVVCGSVSDNLVCLDFDAEGSYEHWRSLYPDWAERMPTARSSRGHHVFVRTEDRPVSTGLFLTDFDGKAGDLIGDGKLVVLPPTRHPSGFVRTWVRKPTGPVPTVKLEDLGVITLKITTAASLEGPLLAGTVSEGDRHGTLRRLAAMLANRGVAYSVLRPLLSAVNRCQCIPPLPEHEVQSVADWAGKIATGHLPLGTGIEDDGLGRNANIITTLSLGDDEETDGFELYGHLFRSCPEYVADQGEDGYRWVVDGLLPESYLVVLGGTSKAGKSTFTTALSMAVANGEPFLGMDTAQGAVLWCAYEESETERAHILRSFPSQPADLYVTHEKLHIDSEEGLEALRWWVRHTGAKLLVIDPLYGANTAESLSDGRKARETLAGLKELCRTESVCAIVIHHFTKNVGAGLTRERFADSNQILATASMDLLMDASDRPDGAREIRLVGRGRGAFANQTWLVKSSGVTAFELLASGSSGESDAALRTEQVLSVVRESDGPATADEIAERAGLNPKSTRNLLTELAKRGELVVAGKRGNAFEYVPSDPKAA